MKVLQSSALTVAQTVDPSSTERYLGRRHSRDTAPLHALRSAGHMARRSITWILVFAAIALACGPHARRGDGDAHASVPDSHQSDVHTPADTSLVASAKVAVRASDVEFA